MTLENLLAIHRLQAFEPNAAGVLRLLASAGRNLAEAAVRECLSQAETLLAHTRQWLQTHRPDLLTENH